MRGFWWIEEGSGFLVLGLSAQLQQPWAASCSFCCLSLLSAPGLIYVDLAAYVDPAAFTLNPAAFAASCCARILRVCVCVCVARCLQAS